MLSSHIIFSPRDHVAATTLVKLFDRLGEPVPPLIRELSVASIEVGEQTYFLPLCVVSLLYVVEIAVFGYVYMRMVSEL